MYLLPLPVGSPSRDGLRTLGLRSERQARRAGAGIKSLLKLAGAGRGVGAEGEEGRGSSSKPAGRLQFNARRRPSGPAGTRHRSPFTPLRATRRHATPCRPSRGSDPWPTPRPSVDPLAEGPLAPHRAAVPNSTARRVPPSLARQLLHTLRPSARYGAGKKGGGEQTQPLPTPTSTKAGKRCCFNTLGVAPQFGQGLLLRPLLSMPVWNRPLLWPRRRPSSSWTLIGRRLAAIQERPKATNAPNEGDRPKKKAGPCRCGSRRARPGRACIIDKPSRAEPNQVELSRRSQRPRPLSLWQGRI